MTPKKQRFIDEYLATAELNATEAARRAGYRHPEVMGPRLTKEPAIKAAIEAVSAERQKRTGITADRVLQELHALAFADANGIIEHRRICCRYCYGRKHRYQFTAAEMEREKEDFERVAEEDKAFDPKGGTGYDPRRDPNPKCPECFGDGATEIFIHDTRKLTGPVKALYAGAKQTKEGIEIKMHSKEKALELLFRHLGLAAPDKHEVSGKDGGPIEIDNVRERITGRLARLAATGAAQRDPGGSD